MSEHDLKVILDAPYNRYRPHEFPLFPGDKVSGKVKLELAKETEIRALEVQLLGQCKTSLDSNVHNTAFSDGKAWVGDVCSEGETLVRGPVTLQPGTYFYPFTLQLPRTMKFSRNVFGGNTLDFRKQIGTHPLPPTARENGLLGSYATTYEVRATIPRSTHSLRQWRDSTWLHVSVYRNQFQPELDLKVVKAQEPEESMRWKLDEQDMPTALSTRQTMKSALHRSKDVSEMKLTLMARAPTVMIIGRPYTIDVQLNSASTEGRMDVVPDFKIKMFKLILKRRATVRVPGFNLDHQGIVESSFTINSNIYDSLLPLNTRKAFTDFVAWKNAWEVMPSYTSVAVRQEYGLELKLTVSSLGKDFDFTFYWRKVTLLPTHMPLGVEDGDATTDGRRASINGLDDPPPPYTTTGQEGVIIERGEETPEYVGSFNASEASDSSPSPAR